MESGPFQAKGGNSINRIFRLSLLPGGMLPCYIQAVLIETTTGTYESVDGAIGSRGTKTQEGKKG
jgi:hypothetical protein